MDSVPTGTTEERRARQTIPPPRPPGPRQSAPAADSERWLPPSRSSCRLQCESAADLRLYFEQVCACLSCSFGFFGLSGLSCLFRLSCSLHQINQIDKIKQKPNKQSTSSPPGPTLGEYRLSDREQI